MFIGFLGIGQGGSNIAEESAKEGFYSAAINFSQSDLNSLSHIKYRLKLVGSEGIGKQRSHSIELMNDNWDLATSFVKEKFSHSSIEIIFVTFSTAGGTGAGVSPILIDMLTDIMPEKTFVAVPIIPDAKEVVTNQINCLNTFEDLSKLDVCILPIDNDKTRKKLNNVGRGNLYEYTNGNFVSLIKTIVDYTDKESVYGVLDKRDLKTLFSTKGMSTIAQKNLMIIKEENDITKQGISSEIQRSWNMTQFADIELEQIISAGIIFDGQEALLNNIDTEIIFSIFKNKMPVSLFEGYYTKGKGRVISILTGLSWCNKRLSEIERLIDSKSEQINCIKTDNHYKSGTTNLIKFSNVSQKSEVKDISDIINKFKR